MEVIFYNFKHYITYQPLELDTISECVLRVVLLTDYLVIRLQGVVVWDYKIIFNTNTSLLTVK